MCNTPTVVIHGLSKCSMLQAANLAQPLVIYKMMYSMNVLALVTESDGDIDIFAKISLHMCMYINAICT